MAGIQATMLVMMATLLMETAAVQPVLWKLDSSASVETSGLLISAESCAEMG